MTVSPERIEEALAAANFWLRTLEPCDCPEEVYPTGDRLTIHEPFCSTVMLSVAAALREAQAENERLREEFIVCHARGYPDPFRPVPNTLASAERFVRDHGGIIKRRLATEWAALAPADEAKR